MACRDHHSKKSAIFAKQDIDAARRYRAVYDIYHILWDLRPVNAGLRFFLFYVLRKKHR